jgi:hypothetical protein
LQPAFARKGCDEPALRGIGNQTQRAVQTRLAAAVVAGDDGEAIQRHHQIA